MIYPGNNKGAWKQGKARQIWESHKCALTAKFVEIKWGFGMVQIRLALFLGRIPLNVAQNAVCGHFTPSFGQKFREVCKV